MAIFFTIQLCHSSDLIGFLFYFLGCTVSVHVTQGLLKLCITCFLSTDFNVFHMIAVGLSSSILGCLVTLLVYTYCQRYQQQSHDATVIHPISAAPLNTSITNHINKLDKYDSVEAIKVCVLSCPSSSNHYHLHHVLS